MQGKNPIIEVTLSCPKQIYVHVYFIRFIMFFIFTFSYLMHTKSMKIIWLSMLDTEHIFEIFRKI